MNKIFKVIWSKTRNCYVVASELAKGTSKSTSTGRMAKRAALAAVAALLISPLGAGYVSAADADYVTVKDSSGTEHTVYTKDGVDAQLGEYAKNSDISDLKAKTEAIIYDKDSKTVMVDGKLTATKGITDGTTTQKGQYVKADNYVGQNLNALDTQVKANADAINEEARKRKYSVTNLENADKQLQTNINNEAAAREAGDKALNDRITNVKEYVLSETNKNYVSKTDAAVQDGAIVKAANTIGDNVTKLDAALAKETADRLGADAAQDKVIQQVNDNLVSSVNTINKNMADGFNALSQADANELAGRVAADTELVKATNGGLALNNKNVLQKNETTIAEDGTVTTKTTAADTLIMNEGKKNQITLSENGIKVGKNSGVMDKDGFYAGGDNADAAAAALKADGSIKGANGNFTVDGTTGDVSTNGSLTATSGKIGNVSMSADSTMTGVKDLTASGKITADSFTDGTATMSNGSLNGVNQINATGNIVTTGNMQAHDMTATGTITGQNINGTTGTFGSLTTTGNASVGGTLTTNGITNTGNATTDTLTVNHNATVGGNLGVTGDITGKSLNVGTGSISGGQITGTGLDVGAGTIKTTGATETGMLKTTGKAEIGGDLSVAGKTEMKGNLDVKGDLSVEGKFNANTLSSKLDENNYTTINGGKTQSWNLKMDPATSETKASASTFDETGSNLWAKDDDSIGKSTVTADGISQKLSDTGDNPTAYAESAMSQGTDNKYTMTDTVKDGDKTNVASQSATDSSNVITDENKNTSTFRQKVDSILQEINNADNTKSSSVEQKLDSINSKVTDGANTTSVEQGTQNITNTATNGTISNIADKVMNQGTTSVTSQIGDGSAVKSEMTAAGITNTAVGGTITNSAKDLVNTATGDMTNTVGGKMLNKVTGDMENKVGGNLTTTVGGKETHTVGGTLTETVTGDVTKDYKANLSTTVGGSQTTTVTGDSSLTAENITNTAAEKLSNSAADIENKASNSILNQVGDNTSWKMTDGQVVESIKGTDGQTNTTTTTSDNTYQSVQNGNNVLAKKTSSTNDNLNITDGTNTYTKITTATSNKQTVTDGKETASTNLTKSASNTYITNGTQTVTNHIAADTTNTVMNEGNNGSRQEQTASQILNRVTDGTDTSEVKQTASEVATSAKDITNTASEKITNQIGDGSKVKSEMTADGITNTAEGGTIYNKSKDILNEASGDILNFADGEIGNVATKITNITGNNTVTSDTNGTTFENTANSTVIKEGTVTKTTISGNTLETGQATMDYADVMKDLGVRGSTTLGTTANDKLTVNATSTFNENVSMKKDLSVGGTTTTDKLVVNNGATIAGGATVTGGTTTDTLKVTGSSEFGGKATFNDIVKMNKGLSVTGGVTADTVTADSYKVGDKIYIDSNGINANNHNVVNVAPGRIAADSTDAVNGSQLYQTNERVTGVENKVNKLDSRVDKVGANAAALANLHPLEFDADSKWNIAAAVGGYKGETATAIGAFYRPNENVMVNVSSSFGTGENMYGGGISLRIGQGGNKARRNATNGLTDREKAMQKQIDSLTNRLDALLSVINPNMSKDFPDVPENHWAYEAVSRLAGNGVIQGYEDGKYHGDRTMTRYEMAEIIYNALSKGAKAEKKLVEEFKPELQAMAAQKKA